MARLAGIDAAEVRRQRDHDGRAGRAREEDARLHRQRVSASALEGSETRDIKIPLRDRTVEFKGLAFLQYWAIPNFFFHHVTAYNLLRHNGVDIGKRDFLGG